MSILEAVAFDQRGLVSAIAQDAASKDVLMLAYMNRESLEKTVETGVAHYFSRSRQRIWMKGEESGNFQRVKDIRYDCDADALLLLVEQQGGAACHTGHSSCFYRSLNEAGDLFDRVFDPKDVYGRDILNKIAGVIRDRRSNPKEGSYTNYLFNSGIDKMLKKVGEEAAEVIIAAKNDDKKEITLEVSDLMYHLSVVLVQVGLSWDDVYEELRGRYK